MMIRIIPFFALIVLLTNCQKDDESALNDYELFGRLQANTGMWQVEKMEASTNDSENPTVTTTEPENDFFHFYIRTSQISGVLVEIATVDIYIDGAFNSSFPVAAETERVVFEGVSIGTGTVWTVIENKNNRQIWELNENNATTRIYLKRCDCGLPIPSGETGG